MGAWAELLERDAFQRAWFTRELLPRLRLSGGDDGHGPYQRDLEDQGWEIRAFALRPDDLQPIICALAVRDEQLALGASAASSGPGALTKAMREAWSGAVLVPETGEEVPAPEEVRTPGDHRRLYRWGRQLSEAAFLWEGEGNLDPRELGPLPQPPDDLITVTWPSWVCEPLHVVRVLHPDLIPMTFGHGREPLGRPDVAAMVREGGASALFPHPFP